MIICRKKQQKEKNKQIKKEYNVDIDISAHDALLEYPSTYQKIGKPYN